MTQSDAPYTVTEARYSRQPNGKPNWLIRCPSPDGYKTRACRLISNGLNCRYTHREGGYIASDAKRAKFEKLYAEGWDASSWTGELEAPLDES